MYLQLLCHKCYSHDRFLVPASLRTRSPAAHVDSLPTQAAATLSLVALARGLQEELLGELHHALVF